MEYDVSFPCVKEHCVFYLQSIDCDVLFGNLVAISELSKKLLESLLKIDQGGESNIGKHIG